LELRGITSGVIGGGGDGGGEVEFPFSFFLPFSVEMEEKVIYQFL
jgi:hypothetical protein